MVVKPSVRLVNPEAAVEALKNIGWAGSISAGLQGQENRYKGIARHCLESGHLSTSRNVLFKFEIYGVSRVMSHQFVREKMGVDPVQMSQRYIDAGGFGYVQPASVEGKKVKVTFPGGDGDEWAMLDFEDIMDILNQMYNGYVEQGVKKEDARFVLPNAAETGFHVSLSYEALRRVAGMRLCTRAQWEIRAIVQAMVNEVVTAAPELAGHFVAKCEREGYCTEANTCGRRPLKKEVLKDAELGRRIRGVLDGEGTDDDVMKLISDFIQNGYVDVWPDKGGK